MAGPTKSEALALFSYSTPGYRPNAIWNREQVVEPPQETGLVISDRELLAAPLPWAQFETSKVSVSALSNLDAWVTNAVWSNNDGTSINTDPPQWQSSTVELSQLACKITIDDAVEIGESDYNVVDVALRALAEMMLTTAYTSFFATTPVADAPESLYDIATAESNVQDPPEGSGMPLSFKGLMCLRQMLNVQVGAVEQYTMVLAQDVYAQFVQLMASSGISTLELDSVTGKKQWFFDRVRVIESSYVPDGNALIMKFDMAGLPESLRENLSAMVGRGFLIASTHAPGVVISNFEPEDGTDQSQIGLQLNVGLIHGTNCVGWMENIG